MDDRWFGNVFQIFEATDANDLEVALVVLHGEHILTEMKNSRVLAPVHIVGWQMQEWMAAVIVAPESNHGNFKANSVANRKPIPNQKEQVWCGRTEVFVRPLEQEYSGHAEGESELKRRCQPKESCRKQVGSQLLIQL